MNFSNSEISSHNKNHLIRDPVHNSLQSKHSNRLLSSAIVDQKEKEIHNQLSQQQYMIHRKKREREVFDEWRENIILSYKRRRKGSLSDHATSVCTSEVSNKISEII